jgi:hypothetical protein
MANLLGVFDEQIDLRYPELPENMEWYTNKQTNYNVWDVSEVHLLEPFLDFSSNGKIVIDLSLQHVYHIDGELQGLIVNVILLKVGLTSWTQVSSFDCCDYESTWILEFATIKNLL